MNFVGKPSLFNGLVVSEATIGSASLLRGSESSFLCGSESFSCGSDSFAGGESEVVDLNITSDLLAYTFLYFYVLMRFEC